MLTYCILHFWHYHCYTFGITIKTIFKMTSRTKSKIQNNRHEYAIVVPCFNDEKRLPYADFLSFAQKHPEVLLCFVDDGSKDKTQAVLFGMQTKSPANIKVYPLNTSTGKAEAVKIGMNYVNQNFNVKLTGFLDSNLSIRPEDWLKMVAVKLIP